MVISQDRSRLDVLRRTSLLDSPPEEAFDRLTRLAVRVVGAPVALVSLVDEDRQFFKSQCGLPEPWASQRETPLSHSFCQHVVATAEPLVIEDAREHPLVRDNPAIHDLEVIAYAGIPLITSAGHTLGSLCVIDRQPRRWSETEVLTLRELAAAVVTEIELRAEVAERRRTEQALRDSEERFRQLAENIPEVFWMVDARADRVIYVSPAFERIWGRPAEGLLLDRSAFLASIHPEDRARGIATPERVRQGEYAEDYRILRPDGEVRWIRDRGFPVFDEAGELVRIAGVAEDITERKRREEADRFLAAAGAVLAASLDRERTLRSVAGLVVPELADHCAIDLTDENGALQRVIVLADPADEQWSQQLETEFRPLGDSPQPAARVLRTGRSMLVSAVNERWLDEHARDQRHREILRGLGLRSVLAVPLVARGRTLGAITLAMGASGRSLGPHDLALAEELARRAALALDSARLYHQARQATRAREELLQIVSHELRTPLRATLLEADLLRDSVAEVWHDRARDRLESVRRGTAMALRLVDDLTDLTQIKAGHLRLRLQAEEVGTAVRDALRTAAASAAERGVRLEDATGEALPPVRADRQRLVQVLLNLLDYAIWATPPQGVVRVGAEPQEGEGVRLFVSDAGPGLPRQHLAAFFEGSWPAAEQASPGMGLGLAIARGIVAAHGGSLGVESQAERGTTVWFTLPAASEAPGGPGTSYGDWKAGAARIVVPAIPAVPAAERETGSRRRARFLDGMRCAAAGAAEAEVLRERVLEAVYTGDLLPGDRMPSVRSLANHLGIGYYGALQLYRELEAEGLVVTRGRSGTFLYDGPEGAPAELGETARWVADMLDQAIAHRVRLPLLPELVRRYCAAVPVRCACVGSTLDDRVALAEEVGRYLGMEPVPVDAAELPSVPDPDPEDLAPALRDADLFATTVFHARDVRRFAASRRRPVAVATLAPAIVEAVEFRVRESPLAVVCVDPQFGERIRGLRGGRYRDRITVVPADDHDAVAGPRSGEPVLLSRAAHEKLQGVPLRLLAPVSPLFSPRFTRELARILVHLNAAGGRLPDPAA